MSKVVFNAKGFSYVIRFKSDANKHLIHRKKQQKFKTNKKAMVNYRQINEEFPYRNGYIINRVNDRLKRVYRFKSSDPYYKSGRRRRLNASYLKDIDISQISRTEWLTY